MTFPAVPRDATVELFLNGGWRDVSSDVRAADGIVITRGRPNEAGQPQPSTCSLTLDNRSGNYSPRNPLSPYYGVLGRNTPIRVSINVAKDAFARTVVDGWGSADVGGSYSLVGAGGTVLNSDAQVNSGVGKQSVPVTNAYRFLYLPGVSYRNVEVAVTVTVPFTDVTGAVIEPANILLRGQSITDYYRVRVLITTAEAVTIGVVHYDNTVIAAEVTVSGLTHASGQALRVRAQVDGHTIRAKVWAAAAPEPYGWHVSAFTDRITGTGWVGIRSGVVSGNTNTLPIVFSYDDLIVRSVRFAGEVASWPQRWNTSGIDVTAPVEAASMLRRLAQGTSPQSSTLYRAITGLTIPAVAYWPCEEGSDSNSIASAVGGPAMFVTGDTDFAAYGGFAASYPIPVPQTASTWSGPVPTYTATGEIQLSFITNVPGSGAANLSYFMELTTQSGRTWSIRYHTGGSMSLQLWEYSTLLFDTGPVAFEVNGKDLRITLTLEQNGSNIDWELQSLKADATGGGLISGTQLNRTVGRALRIRAFPHGEMTGVAMGHISVRKEVVNFWDQSTELRAFAGETVLERLLRLLEQNNIDADFLTRSFGAAVGPQRPLPVLALLQECADADVSTLFDARSAASLLYRQLSTMYAQPATVTLDYTGGQIAPPFQPVDDDQSTRNDISVTRLNGSTARAVLETGRMSVRAPELGGVGSYTTAIEVNVARDDQLPDIAGWELNKGIADETRYPVVRVGLHYPEVASDPVLALALLDLDVGDRFEVVNPMGGQTPDTIDQLVLGYTEAIYPFEHFLAINAAPASPYQVIVLDDSTSKLSTDGSTLAAGVTTTATSLSVTTLSGTLWKTGAVSIPIRVGGEVMTVTNIAGSSSPQTFTVVRSVNGITKLHSSGASVRLTRPAILAL